MPNRTDEQHYVMAHTSEGSYEARLLVDNSNNLPLQKKLNIARYRISEPPIRMLNIPKYYTAKKLIRRHATK